VRLQRKYTDIYIDVPYTIPNLLTWLRILLIPLFVGMFYFPDAWVSAGNKNLFSALLFFFAAITDWLDGYLARALEQTSAFGAFLDPVADKLMVVAALIVLVKLGRVNELVAFIIIGREIAISALREWMAKIGESGGVTVSMLGKVKTASQMTAILLLLYDGMVGGIDFAWLGTWLIYLAAILTLVSMAYYLRMAFGTRIEP
jgi:CDP-diacylglycerol--glycerol-3-phosphate 3-phosphatidyltransferase/cardiolipin synthase